METLTAVYCTVCGVDNPQGDNTYNLWARVDGKAVCLPCAQAYEVCALVDRSRPYVAYLSSDGLQVTGWLGNRLMDVVASHMVRSNWYHVGKLQYVLAKDVHGAWWYGRGTGRGMAIRMHPRKAPK